MIQHKVSAGLTSYPKMTATSWQMVLYINPLVFLIIQQHEALIKTQETREEFFVTAIRAVLAIANESHAKSYQILLCGTDKRRISCSYTVYKIVDSQTL